MTAEFRVVEGLGLGEPMPVALVADDDPAMRLLIANALKSCGIAVVQATTGEEAIAAFDEHRPNLVLLDVEMPGTNGFEVCAEIRRRDPLNAIPIVVVTSHEDRRSIEAAYEAGATDFISKPINWSLLPHRVRYFLRSAEVVSDLALMQVKNHGLIQGIPDMIFVVDNTGRLTEFVSNVEAFPGLDLARILGRPVAEVVGEQHRAEAEMMLNQTLVHNAPRSFEFTVGDGRSERHYECRLVPQTNSEALAIVRDICDRKRYEQAMYRLAFYDELTGLPNRQLFKDRLDNMIRRARRAGGHPAVMYIDIDRFSQIDMSLSHDVVDSLLQSVASRLLQTVRESDAITRPNVQALKTAHAELARFGGDEFAVALDSASSEDDVLRIAARIHDALTKPISYQRHQLTVVPSIGIAHFPRDGEDADALLKNADSAMYAAKKSGRNGYYVFSESMGVDAMRRLDIEQEIGIALERDEFFLHYQPRVCASDRSVVGAEALIRWRHPKRGLISPGEFIPIAEETGQIVDIGHWVLQAVCTQLKHWQNAGHGVVPVSINMSSWEFSRAETAQFLKSSVERHGIKADLIELEITETVLLQDTEAATEVLHELRAAGFKVALDDFGTGYSSMHYLNSLPLNALKIDRSFVDRVVEDENQAKICTAIIRLGQSLGLHVVAEGVETDEQFEFLAARDCDEIQGYLTGRPMDADDFEQLIEMPRESENPRLKLV